MSDMIGMILAAGLGTRLAPITDHLPKPLLPVGGRPLIDHIVAACDRAGMGPLAVNTHHLAPLVRDHLLGRPDAGRFTILHEPQILGTGGALHGARSFLERAEFFLLHNGDVWSDLDLGALIGRHRQEGNLATLAVVDWPEVNSVALAADGAVVQLAGRPAAGRHGVARRLTYTGIGVLARDILADIQPGFSSLVDALARAIARRPGCVRGFAPEGLDWSDLGTLPRYLEVAAGVDGPAPQAAPAGCRAGLQALTGHGSDRRFWRLSCGDWSAVAMQCPPAETEFTRFVDVARFLQDQGLGAPALLAVHERELTLLMEDVGPTSLQAAARTAPAPQVQDYYRRILDDLVRLQAATPRAGSDCPVAVDRVMDYEHLRWESGYFREHFLGGHLGITGADLPDLEQEFHNLAACVARQPRVLLHRDFQSQNIFLQNGRVRLVDFQGMRLGPVGYDAASLLWDPYVALDGGTRDGLLAHFCRKAGPPAGLAEADLAQMVLTAGLQRLLQALGAYGYLGRIKAKPEFLAHVPRGIANLRDLLHRLDDSERGAWSAGPLPRLAALVEALPAG